MSEAEDFLGVSARPIARRPSDVRTRRKLFMVFAAWLAGLLIACPDPRAVGCIPLFPFGLWGFISAWAKQGSENVILVCGWLIYCALTITTLVMGRRKWFYIWWAVLTMLLLVNGAGCHAMLKGLSQIH